jgi:very-short-patch-repair endonuclease
MILDERTFEKFGYRPNDLTSGSNSKVVIKCDYCETELDKPKKAIKKSHEIVAKDCCGKCKHKKIEEVNRKKYGCDNQFQRKEIIDEMRPELVERLKSREFKDKARATMIDKYGVANAMHSEELAQKQKDNMLEKYGYERAFQIPEVKEKIKKENLEKYGNEYFLGSEAGRKASIDGIIRKYGTQNAFQAEEVKEKIKETCLSKYGFTHHFKDKDRAIKNAADVVEAKKRLGTIKLYNGKTVSELRQDSGYSDSQFRTLINEFGYDEALRRIPYISSLEQVVAKWLADMGLTHNKKKIERYFPDFNIDGKNLIIECGSTYWHGDSIQPDNDYHVKKKQFYTDRGYKSLFFWDDEVRDKPEIVKSIIRNKAGLITDKVAARKCQIVIPNKKEARKFIEENHLMGPGPSSVDFFLVYDGSPVACLQMKLKNRKTLEYEISRFCSKINMSVMGAFSRLLKYFEDNYEHNSIFTFIDKRYGEGNYLEDMGFFLKSCYTSFDWTNSKIRYNRSRFPGNSGYSLKYRKVWDCGQAKYVKIRN